MELITLSFAVKKLRPIEMSKVSDIPIKRTVQIKGALNVKKLLSNDFDLDYKTLKRQSVKINFIAKVVTIPLFYSAVLYVFTSMKSGSEQNF